jgi:LmbE family N-acetylglucosaminyl deacetylase
MPESAPTARVVQIGDGGGRCILLIVAHADDAALFLGGTVARWAAAGWRVVCVRVTDDRWDAHGIGEPESIARNAAEFATGARVLGIAQVEELGYPTDVLGDESEVRLRERFIRLVRRHRPFAIVSFDPYAVFGEDNEDHLLVGRAANETFWTAQFDLHHPEHRAEGLEPHGCFERWYFGRQLARVTDVVDVSSTLDVKVHAAVSHRTAMLNFAHQLVLQARTGGRRVPLAERALERGDPSELVETLVRRGTRATGARHGLEAAEEFRVVRFGGLQDLLDDPQDPT